MTPHELKRALLNLRVRRNNEMATYNRKSISYGDYQGVNLALGCSVPKHNNWYLTAPAGPWKFANATPVL